MLDQPAGRLIADFGAPGRSENPGHQHAGIFSYEVSTPEGRLIVDRGTSTYAEGPERDALRGTGAHNTVRVDGVDQFDAWKSFRIGRRADAHGVRTHSESDYGYVTGWHDGYRSIDIRHRRTIFNLQIGGWLVVDNLLGLGWHAVESLIHLAPTVLPEVSEDAVELKSAGWSVAMIAPPDISVLTDVHSPRLGVRLATTTLAARSYAELPLTWMYWIVPHPRPAIEWRRSGDGQLGLSTAIGRVNISLLFIAAY